MKHPARRVKLILFLGSGVSRDSGLPLAGELTNAILGSTAFSPDAHSLPPRLGAGELRQRVENLLQIMVDFDTRDAKRTKALFRGPTSYEDLFYMCEEMANWRIGLADNSTVTPFMKALERRARALLNGATLAARLDDLGLLAREARLFIQSTTTTLLRGRKPVGLDVIVDLARSERIEQLNIVTLNHDTLVEQLMEERGVELADGFGPPDGDVRWYDDQIYDVVGRTPVRLFKLHGSVSWYRFVVDGLPRTAVIRRNDGNDLMDGKRNMLRPWIQDASFLTGGNKAIRYQHGIYLDLLFRFQEVLRNCDVMLMCGYGWGDAAINLRLETWMDNPRKRVVLLHPNPEEITARSMIIASAYNWWVSSGRLITVPRWLSQLSREDLESVLFQHITSEMPEPLIARRAEARRSTRT